MRLSAPEYIEELRELRGYMLLPSWDAVAMVGKLVDSFLDERGNSTDCLHRAMQLLFAEPLPPISIAAKFLNQLRRRGTSIFYRCQNRAACRTWYSKALLIFAMTLAALGLNLRAECLEPSPVVRIPFQYLSLAWLGN